MILLFWIITFLVSLIVLVFSADRFTKSAEKLGAILGIPSFIIGVTIVSVGTSLPELMTSLVAVIKSTPAVETTQVVIGNVVGSNIANILLVIGIATLIAKKLEVKRSLIELDIPLLILSTGLLILMMLDHKIVLIEGIILLLGYGVYLRYSLSEHSREEVDSDIEKRPFWKIFEKRGKLEGKLVFGLIVYAILIYLGAKYTIEALINISSILDIATSVIAASVIAIGTSLPELAVTILAARRGEMDIAVGNIFGSNIFNTLLVVGVPALIAPLVVPDIMITIGIPFFVAATLVFVISGISRKVYSFEGAFYILIYLVFIAKLFQWF